ncbi:MAG: hypothetical protein HY288_18540 [Planctomycetia bacterium]|nr:hypothetical protein [Planctomycetia bacterium]
MKIQVLFFEGCPNYKTAIDLVRSVAPNATIEEVEIKTPEDAERMRFLGSPTILVDGVDVEPSARTRTDFGFSCRTYNGMGLPSREIVVSAIASDCCSRPSFERSGSLWLGASSVAVAAIASACCWLPLVGLAFGMSAVGLSSTFETFRPWLFVGAGTLLAAGFYSAYRREPCCAAKSKRFNRAMIWIATSTVLAFAILPPYAGKLVGAVKGPACCAPQVADTPTGAFLGQPGPLGKCCAPQETDTPKEPDGSLPPRESKAAPAERKPSLTVLSDDAHELKDAFNADKAAVKVVLIVSPRCPACRKGATVVQEQALAQVDSDKLKVYVVWIKRYFGDSRVAAQEATELVSDSRARHFWDGSGQLGKWYGKILDLPGKRDFAWDVYFVFDSKSEWAEAPTTPDFWMHQLGGPETPNMLDGGLFREAIVRRLP